MYVLAVDDNVIVTFRSNKITQGSREAIVTFILVMLHTRVAY